MALSAWLDEHGCSHVAMEATGVYWRPVWHVLSEEGRTLILANAGHVKNVPGRETDVADAVWLSDLLAHGLIRASFVPEAQTRAMRTLLRTRKPLVRERAAHVQRIQRTLEEANLGSHRAEARWGPDQARPGAHRHQGAVRTRRARRPGGGRA